MVSLEGAPADFDFAKIAAPTLASPEQARRGARGLVVVPVTAGADAILALRAEFGAERLLVTAGDDPADEGRYEVVDGLLQSKLDLAQVKQLLGGNFLRLVDSLRQPTPTGSAAAPGASGRRAGG